MLRRFCPWLLLALLAVLPAATDKEEALRTAAAAGDLKAVRTLIADGVDPDAGNDYGATALTFAADKGHLEVVRLLVRSGADVNGRDTFYRSTPAEWAVYNGHADVVEYLLEHGAEGVDGMLRDAINRRFPAVVRVLLGRKLTAAQLTNALSMARAESPSAARTEIIAILEAAGARPLPPSSFVLEPHVLARYAGVYRCIDRGLEATVELTDGHLNISYFQISDSPLEPIDEVNFRPQGGADLTIRFQVEDGEVRGLVLYPQGWSPIPFTRVDAEASAAPPTVAEAAPRAVTDDSWPAFRGANAAGVAEGFPLPVSWKVADGTNVAWRRTIPGRAHSSPIIWGPRLFLTTAISAAGEAPFRHGLYSDTDVAGNRARHVWRLYALDKRSGEILWQRDAHEGTPRADNHVKATQANATPVTDGKHLVAVLGSEGLFCYDLDGNLKWRRDLGLLDVGWFYNPSYQWGHGSSPIIYQDRVIVQIDRNREPFIAAYALADGRELWRTGRDNLPSWATPTIFAVGAQVELVANGSRRIRGYDPRTGKELWSLGPNSEVAVATPVVGHGLVFVTCRYQPVQPLYAIRPGGRGDLSLPEGASSSAQIAWSDLRTGTRIPTPIVYGKLLYTVANSGLLTSYLATTGERVYRQRLGGRAGAFTASPVAGDGKLYMTSEDGDVHVVKAGPQYELLAVNPMDEVVMASPAISEGMFYVRGLTTLFAVGKKAE